MGERLKPPVLKTGVHFVDREFESRPLRQSAILEETPGTIGGIEREILLGRLIRIAVLVDQQPRGFSSVAKGPLLFARSDDSIYRGIRVSTMPDELGKRNAH